MKTKNNPPARSLRAPLFTALAAGVTASQAAVVYLDFPDTTSHELGSTPAGSSGVSFVQGLSFNPSAMTILAPTEGSIVTSLGGDFAFTARDIQFNGKIFTNQQATANGTRGGYSWVTNGLAPANTLLGPAMFGGGGYALSLTSISVSR